MLDLKFFSTAKRLLFPKKFPNNVHVPIPNMDIDGGGTVSKGLPSGKAMLSSSQAKSVFISSRLHHVHEYHHFVCTCTCVCVSLIGSTLHLHVHVYTTQDFYKSICTVHTVVQLYVHVLY